MEKNGNEKTELKLQLIDSVLLQIAADLHIYFRLRGGVRTYGLSALLKRIRFLV